MVEINRSAETGKFVSDEKAETSPATTVTEQVPSSMSPSPAVGRVAHYISYVGTRRGEYQSQCRAAIITEVGNDGLVGLAVLNPTGLFFHSLADGGCDYSHEKQGGTWHWPERI